MLLEIILQRYKKFLDLQARKEKSLDWGKKKNEKTCAAMRQRGSAAARH